MAHPKPERDFPYCLLCLVACALACHMMAFVGTVRITSSMHELGQASGGWSDVGLGLADTMGKDLDLRMHDVLRGMTGAISVLTTVHARMEELVAGVGGLQKLANHTDNVSSADRSSLTATTKQLVDLLAHALSRFAALIKPVFSQVNLWLSAFGEKLQRSVELFSVGLDIVQKLFDQLMKQFHGGGANEEVMRRHTFGLFDVSGTGEIFVSDLQNVSTMYSIPALQGLKARELLEKYDADGNQALSRQEFASFVQDEAIPESMAVVLRAYAKKLARISGELAGARTRDEVALAVARWLQMRAAKNLTRVSWVIDALTNSSLSLPFAADVLAQLALTKDNPNQFSTVDVGEVVVGEMVRLSPARTTAALELLSNASFWESEGFDTELQSTVAEQVARWVSKAQEAHLVLPLLAALFGMPGPAGLGKGAGTDTGANVHAEAIQPLGTLGASKVDWRLEREGRLRPERGHARGAASLASTAPTGLHTGGAGGHRAAARVDDPDEDDEDVLLQCTRRQARQGPELTVEAGNGCPGQVQEEEVTLLQARQHSSSRAAMSRSGQWSSQTQEVQAQAAVAAAQRHALLQLRALPAVARLHAEHSRRAHERQKRVARSLRKQALLSMHGSREFAQRLSLGMASVGDVDPEVVRIVNSGVPVRPETLRWASWLSSNASGRAKRFQQRCFDYTSQSSGTMDSVAQQISRMMKRFQDFLGAVEEHASPRAVAKLERWIQDFVHALQVDLVAVLSGNFSARDAALGNFTDTVELLSAAWGKVSPALGSLLALLPTSIDTLKLVRKEVSQTSAALVQVFDVFKDKGPPIFSNAAALYKTLWAVYFVLFSILTVALLLFAFSEAGLCGGDGADAERQAYEPPQTLLGRCRACCAGCCSGFGACNNSYLCFWSVVLCLEMIWLVMFVVSSVIMVLMGLRAFMSMGCKSVYILGDNLLCTEALEMVSKWLGSSSWIAGAALPRACSEKSLLVCNLLSEKLASGLLFTAVGNTAAAVLSFQLIIDSAILHERHRWHALLDTDQKNA